MKFYPSILNQEELFLLKNLSSLKEVEFYLAGGTALALQLGHRTSIDLDFYRSKKFQAGEITRALITSLPKIKIIGIAEGTIFGKLASIEDIAAMKVAAVIQRGTQRDFIDIYYLLKKYSLKKIISLTLKKYPGYQEQLILQALIYFKDTERKSKKRPIKISDKKFSWGKAKKEIFEKVREYQLEMIKKT